MSYRKASFLIDQSSLDENTTFEGKLSYLKTNGPKIINSQVFLNCEVKCVTITLDEKFAVVGLEDGDIQMISIVTTDEEFESCIVLKGHKAEVKCLLVTKSNLLISGSYDKLIIIWDILEKKQKLVLEDNNDKILSMSISKDSSLLISASIDNIIRIWDLQHFKQIHIIKSIKYNSYATCISNDNNFLILGCNDNTIRIWNIAHNSEEAILKKHTWPIYSLALTSDGHYLISTGMDHSILKWDMKTYKNIGILGKCSDTIYSLAITTDNLFIIFGKYNGDLGIVSLEGDMPEVNFPCHKNCVNSICVSSSNKFIISGARDRSVQISMLSENPEIQYLDGHEKRICNLSVSSDSQMMASASEDCTIIIWRLGVEDYEGILRGHKGPVYTAIFTSDSCMCISGSQDKSIIIWDLSSEIPLNTLCGHDQSVTCLALDPREQDLVSGSYDKTIRIWSLETYDCQYIFKGHSEKVNSLVYSNDLNYIISGGKDKIVHLWNVSDKSHRFSSISHDEEITSLCFANSRHYKYTLLPKSKSKNSKYFNTFESEISQFDENFSSERIITGSLDRTVRIWNYPSLECEYILPCKKEVYKVCVTFDSMYMFLQMDKKYIKIWSLPDKQELITLYEENDINALCLSHDRQWLAFSTNKRIHMVRSPLNKESSYTVLPYKYSYLFKALIHRILNNDKSQKKTIFANYFICTHNLSILHVLTYASHSKMLKSAIQDGAKFFQTKTGETPLSIALVRKSKICAEILIKMFSIEHTAQHPYIFEYLKDLLPVLNKSSLPSLHSLYNASFPIIDDYSLPTFGNFIKSPPMILMSDLPKIDPSLFIPISPSEQTLKDSELEFRRSMITINLSPGSWQCITFMRSLLKCNNLEIFRTEFIKTVLKYKWRQIRWVLITQLCAYIFLLLIIVIHTVYARDNIALMIAAVIVNTFFLVHEVLQAISGIKSYLTDVWNMLDACRIVILYAHTAVTMANTDKVAEDVLLALLTIIMWTRLVGFLRIFDGTRYLIHMIMEVIKNLRPFLILFFLTNLGATFTFYSNAYQDNFGEWLLSTYSIAYGNWSFNQDTNLKWVIFFCTVLINTLVFLNLLVAFISDTFRNVKEQFDIVGMRELADIILEVDSITYWGRTSGRKQFLLSCNIAGSHKKIKGFEKDTKILAKVANELNKKSKSIEHNLERLNVSINHYSSFGIAGKYDTLIEVMQGIKGDLGSFRSEVKAEIKKMKNEIVSVKSRLENS